MGKGKKTRAPARRRVIAWSTSLPFVARSVVLTRDALLAAGGQDLAASTGSHGHGRLWLAARDDGRPLGTWEIPAPPVLDGAIVTSDGIFVSMLDGGVACMRE